MKGKKPVTSGPGAIFFCLLLCLTVFVSGSALAVVNIDVEDGTQQVQIPLIVDFSDSIAGAQFSFSFTDGLDFVVYEPSEVVDTGIQTPVVEKGGFTYIGFYSASNSFKPVDGILDMGFLLFDYQGTGIESILVTEIKLVTINDNNMTSSYMIEPIVIEISREGRTNPETSASPPEEDMTPDSGFPTDTDRNEQPVGAAPPAGPAGAGADDGVNPDAVTDDGVSLIPPPITVTDTSIDNDTDTITAAKSTGTNDDGGAEISQRAGGDNTSSGESINTDTGGGGTIWWIGGTAIVAAAGGVWFTVSRKRKTAQNKDSQCGL